MLIFSEKHANSSEEFVPATQDVVLVNIIIADQIGNVSILFSYYYI